MGNIITRTYGSKTVVYTYGRNHGLKLPGAPVTHTVRERQVYLPLLARHESAASQQPFAVVATSAGFRAGYDRNGNMLARVEMSGTQVITYVQEWTVENRLAVVTNTVTGDATRFVYDGDGNRIARQDPTGLTVNVGAIEVEISGTQRLTTTYYFAGGQRIAMRKDGKVTYLHGDHLGSASLATDASGAKVSAMRYTPFGETRFGDAPTDRRFTGQREEAGIGLYDYGARFYSASLGRFISADTIVPQANDPQDFNRYSYVGNNPVKYVDPTGHWYGPDPYDPAAVETCKEQDSFWEMYLWRYPEKAAQYGTPVPVAKTWHNPPYPIEDPRYKEFDLCFQNRQVGNEGAILIRGVEGFDPNLYNDPGNNCTIGWGHQLHTGPCNGDSSEQSFVNGISNETGRRLFQEDVSEATDDVNSLVTVPLTQPQFDALTSFAYNRGSLSGSQVLDYVNARQFNMVPAALLKHVYAIGAGYMPGLETRREREGTLFKNGCYCVQPGICQCQ